ncbi:Hypothetical predicted protein [Lecanosticta acicola]|uniref:Uncharacterized protein n=1 Tax=Lecanosticta acicola TaxID=111012 RepID=A0AAI8YSC2_9PEZI|nr:Hypothetical predicted protein [Lecanosticta acicola]
MAPAPLSLFPAPSTSSGLPRKTSLRRNKSQNTPNANGEVNLKGVAFQVVNSPISSHQVQPPPDPIKHSLFCDPYNTQSRSRTPEPRLMTSSDSSPKAPLRRQSATRRRSNPLMQSPSFYEETSATEDRLAPLPVNTHFGSGSPSKRGLVSQLKRPNVPFSIQPEKANTPTSPTCEDDQLSPLPSKTQFQSPKQSSESPASFYSTSSPPGKTASSPASTVSTSMRSLFPVYDPSRPLDRQSYYPNPDAVSPPISVSESFSKISRPVDRAPVKRNDSALGLVDGYEHIHAAAHCDMVALWKASRDEHPVAGRKVQLGLYQPPGNGKSLAIGTSPQDLIYSLTRDHDIDDSGLAPKQFAIKKHCPIAPATSSVAKLSLPQWKSDKLGKEINESTAIFPHAAALDAIEAIADSSEAQHIAAYDPTAQSQQAAHLAQDAVNEAHRRYSCNLIKRARTRDTLGAVTAAYALVHPIIGTCAVTVSKSFSSTGGGGGGAGGGPRAKISLHHPSATPAAVAADTLNLAFIDFAHDACVIDLPGLLALKSHYILDTVLSSLLAVAVLENDILMRETTTFGPPPRAPVGRKPSFRGSEIEKDRKKEKGKKGKRLGLKKRREVTEMVESSPWPEEELGGLAKGTLAVMELGFKAAAWVIVGGVKVGFKVGGMGVEALGKVAKKG